jgi:hypothetical protein
MIQNKSRKKKNINNGRPKNMPKSIPKSPPPINTKIFLTHTFRYTLVTTAGLQVVSGEDLYGMLSISTTVGSAAVSAISSMRLKKITIWQTGALGASATVSLEPVAISGSFGSKPVILTDTSYSVNDFARIVYVPTKDSTLAAWSNSITGNSVTADWQLNITANIGDIMDVKIDFCLNINDATITSASSAVSGPSRFFGTNLPQAGGNWTPVSFQK